MNALELLFTQQMGNCKWTKYDEILQRLRCSKQEHFTEILPDNSEESPYETPIFACKFAQKAGKENILALANEDGKLALHDVNSGLRKVIPAHDNAIFDLAWMFGKMTIATASGDHTSRLFEVTPSDVRQVKVFFGHSRSVKTIAARPDDPSVFATGGRDGKIILWDSRSDLVSINGKADRTICASHNTCGLKGKKRDWGLKSVTGLVFKDDYSLVSCGAGDGFIKIWDLRRNYLVYNKEPLPKFRIPYVGTTSRNGFSNIVLDEARLKLYANCLDNNIYCYNMNTCDHQPIMTYSGLENSTFYVKAALSHDGNYLISGSSDHNAYIWALDRPQPLVKLTGHAAEVTCVTWSKRDHVLVTCSDDMTHKIWRVGTEDVPENWEVMGRGHAVPVQSPRKRPATKKPICDKCGSGRPKRKSENSPVDGKRVFSPETNRKRRAKVLEDELRDLPNFVVDGAAPHLIFSPPKKKRQDWLTSLRTERKIRKDMQDLTNSPLNKIPKLDLRTRICSPKSSPKQVQSPILRFCKITSSPCNKFSSPRSSQ